MKVVKLLATTGVTGVTAASLIVSPVLACHPQGKIVKDVQDNTTNSASVNANSESTALSVNKGDTLTYTITVSNQETVEGNQNQADMTNTMLTDTLPAGVDLVSGSLSQSLGTIKAKGSITKTIVVKVTEDQDGALLKNKACYTSESNLGKSYDQSGCDVAIVKVHVPPTPTPTPAPTPTPKPTPQPTVLPNTGAGNFIVPAAIVAVLGYAGYLLRLKRHAA